MIRVLLVDDQVIICEGLKVVLENSPAVRVIGMVHDGADALAFLERQTPDLILMDLKMPGMNGIHATRAIKQRYPHLLILILTTYDEDEWVVDAIRAGANGYLLKDIGGRELIAAVEGAVAGGTPIDPAVAAKLFSYVQHGMPARSNLAQLFTERELAVLRLLASGLSNTAIGERLSLAEGTVRNHVTLIFEKLEVTDRAQATAMAWQYGLVNPSKT